MISPPKLVRFTGAGGIEIMYLSRARKSKLEGFEYFVNNPIAKSFRTRLVSEQLIPDIRHQFHQYICGEKICHVEKFQISMHDRCGEF